MAENSFSSASVAVLISLIIALISAVGALLLQVGSNVLSDVVQVRFGMRRRRGKRAIRLAARLRHISAHRRRLRRLRDSGSICKLIPTPRPQAAKFVATEKPMESELAQAESLAERELRKLIALCAPELDPCVIPLAFTDGQTDVAFRREKVVAALERRAEALMRRGKRA